MARSSRGILAVTLTLAVSATGLGQPPVVVPSQPVAGAPGVMVAPAGAVYAGPQPPPGASPAGPPDANTNKAEEEKKDEKEGDKKDSKDEKKDDKDSSKTIKRPTKPDAPPDPEELKIALGDDGRVQYHFKGQPWPAVLQWLADQSGKDFHWQEAPAGPLNLTTNHRQSIDEIRDRLNRLLLDLGYVLLSTPEDLSLVDLEKLDPSQVPRVAREKLDTLPPHDFVKVSFPLERLLAETAVEELEAMKSPSTKLQAMSATNHLEAMGTVVNLREIAAFLAREQASDPKRHPPRRFQLEHRKASEIVLQLETLLGLASKAPPVPMNPEQARQMAEAAARMQAAQQGGNQGKAAKPKEEPEVHLVADDRHHSILAQAPPDKMAIIEQAIRVLDVEPPGGASLPATIERMHIYHLSAIDPGPVVKTLQEIGNLDRDTVLEVDRDNKAIIAFATLADHVTIRALIEKLDVGGRRFEIIPLRRLKADQVAGAVRNMIFGGRDAPEKKDSSSSSRRWWDYYDSDSRDSQSSKRDGFRVDADVQSNSLWLWANDLELEEVNRLLEKLGEITPDGGRPERVRVLDTYNDEELRELLERLKRAWPGVNPLDIDPGMVPLPAPETPAEPAAEPAPDAPGEPALKTVPKPDPKPPVRTAGRGQRVPQLVLAQFQNQPTAPASGSSPPQSPAATAPAPRPAVTITRNAEGRLVIMSEDARALDMLEEMIARLAPPRKDYRIFHLEHAWAYDVAYNLETFFKEEGRQTPVLDWWGDVRYTEEKSDSDSALSRRRPLRFISDTPSNTILVQGADPQQMRQIEELIKIYDRAEPPDSQNIRQTGTITLRYAKAQAVAESIKEVYRDLLSENDKAFAAGRSQQQGSDYRPWRSGRGDSGEKVEKTPRFKGLLSIGVNERSNTLIISAPAFLFTQVNDLVHTLDKAAEPVATVRVVKVGRGASADRLRQVLGEVMGQGGGTKPSPKPPLVQPHGPHVPSPGRP